MRKKTKLNILLYTDYRQFLRDYYAEKKGQFPSFSYRFFSRMANLRGNNYIQMVMEGKRNLTPDSISKFIKALKFNRKEAAYFECLVLFNQAQTDKDKDRYFERLVTLRPKEKITGIKKDEFEYLTNKYYVAIREMVNLPHFKEDHQWIASQFSPPLRPESVERILNTLLRLGLIDRDETNELQIAVGPVITPPDVESLEIFNFHRQVLKDAKESLLKVPYNLREAASLVISMSQKDIDGVKNIIRKCQEEIIHFINKSKKKRDDVYQVNINMYPVTYTQKDKEID